MCGIFGYLGTKNAVEVVADGLQSLEYRGYDSAGVAFHLGCEISVVKSVGKVSELKNAIKAKVKNPVGLSIGHTRWATHGGVTVENCHPHTSYCGSVSVVHNGIIENYAALREELGKSGVKFKSQTDTEVIPNMVVKQTGSLASRVRAACKSLLGSYAFLVISKDDPDTIVAAKKGTQPLCVGEGADGVYFSSDARALSGMCKNVFVLEDGEFAQVVGKEITFFAGDKKQNKKPVEFAMNTVPVSKGKFPTFMEKEINEIPEVIENLRLYFDDKKCPSLPDLCDLKKRIEACDTIHIAACGTSFFAGQYIAQHFATLGIKRVIVHIASELLCSSPIIGKNDIAFVISQSGETADTLSALQLFKSKGLFTVAICNTQHSSICRYSNMSLPTKAGQEIAVASTKAFIAQALVGEVVAAHVLGKQVDFKKYIVVAKDIVKKSDEIKSIAKKYKDIKKMFFLGKGLTTVIANESALKVKEITYKHAEGIAAGELKHGTLALVDSDTLSIVLVPEDEKAAAKIKNSESEVRSRDSHVWEVPPTPSCLAVMYAQLFALHKTYFMGLDPDKPRNLAKSVTVE